MPSHTDTSASISTNAARRSHSARSGVADTHDDPTAPSGANPGQSTTQASAFHAGSKSSDHKSS